MHSIARTQQIPRRVDAANKNTHIVHHPRRRNVTTSIVRLQKQKQQKNKQTSKQKTNNNNNNKKSTVTFEKNSSKMVNPRDLPENAEEDDDDDDDGEDDDDDDLVICGATCEKKRICRSRASLLSTTASRLESFSSLPLSALSVVTQRIVTSLWVHSAYARVSEQNGVSPLYTIVEIYRSGRKPLMVLHEM